MKQDSTSGSDLSRMSPNITHLEAELASLQGTLHHGGIESLYGVHTPSYESGHTEFPISPQTHPGFSEAETAALLLGPQSPSAAISGLTLDPNWSERKSIANLFHLITFFAGLEIFKTAQITM